MGFGSPGNQFNHPTKADRLKAIEKLVGKLGEDVPTIIYSLPMRDLNTVYFKLERQAVKQGLIPQMGIQK